MKSLCITKCSIFKSSSGRPKPSLIGNGNGTSFFHLAVHIPGACEYIVGLVYVLCTDQDGNSRIRAKQPSELILDTIA